MRSSGGRRARTGAREITRGEPARTTVTVLGDCPVTCQAIAQLLRSGGCEARVAEAAREEPAEPDLVLVTAGDHDPARLAPDAPALWLVDSPEEADRLGKRGLVWPCAAGELRARVAELARAAPV